MPDRKIRQVIQAFASALAACDGLAQESDFAARCRQPGVIKCVSFDTDREISRTYPAVSGAMGRARPVIDTAVKASGSGSLKFTISSNTGPDTYAYFANFSDDLSVQFGENEEFFIQWRQRFSTEFLTTDFKRGNGWKQIIIGTGDKPRKPYASCTALEVVVNNYGYTKAPNQFPVMYNSCTGSKSHQAYDGFYERFARYDFKLQNARPSPYCAYLQGDTKPPSFLPPRGNCFGYFPNEWMTYQIGIKTGPRVNDEFTDSYVNLWIARENQPSVHVINWGPYNLTAGDPAEDQKFGKVWLTPYNGLKDAAHSHATAYTWYDDLIISRTKIADPARR